MAREIEFDVEAARTEGTHNFVVGRCTKGPIRVGDTFTIKYRLIFQNAPVDFSTSFRSEEKSINMTVEAIVIRGCSLTELVQGMGAELRITGDEISAIKHGDFLAGSVDLAT